MVAGGSSAATRSPVWARSARRFARKGRHGVRRGRRNAAVVVWIGPRDRGGSERLTVSVGMWRSRPAAGSFAR